MDRMPDDSDGWYIALGDRQLGPMLLSEALGYVRDGTLATRDLVWRPGWPEWRTAGGTSQFAHAFSVREPRQREPAYRAAAAPAASHAGASPKKTRRQKLVHELVSFGTLALYVLVVLLLLDLHESVVLSDSGAPRTQASSLLFSALILGKVLLIAEILRIGSRIPAPVAAISVLVRCVLFAAFLLLFEVLEHVIIAMVRGTSISAALAEYTSFRRDAVLVLIATVALVPYQAYKELARPTGQNLLSHLFRREPRDKAAHR